MTNLCKKEHVWIGISNGDGTFHDECMNCQVRGEIDFDTGKITAKLEVRADVIDLSEFRRKKNAVG